MYPMPHFSHTLSLNSVQGWITLYPGGQMVHWMQAPFTWYFSPKSPCSTHDSSTCRMIVPFPPLPAGKLAYTPPPPPPLFPFVVPTVFSSLTMVPANPSPPPSQPAPPLSEVEEL